METLRASSGDLVAPPTMADVARLAGVGMATVSRTLSGASGVSESTRLRVQEAAERLDYVVSPEASRLSRGATGRVAVVLPHASRWFFGAVLEGIQSELRAFDMDVLLYQVPDAVARHRFFTLLPARRKVDAVIVVGLPVDDVERDALAAMNVRIVAVGGQSAAFPHVRIDDAEASRQATSHLVALGHRRIAMIEATDPATPEWAIGMARSQGYHGALADAGLAVDERLIARVEWNPERAAAAMGSLLALREPPTAVFAHSDELAVAAVRTIRRAGLDVPHDVSVIGIDDHPIAALTDLTTIAQPAAEQGLRAAAMVRALLDGTLPEPEVRLPTRLVPRGSTARPTTSRRPSAPPSE